MVGYGSGKVILFGDHFVVHREPALVLSLPLRTRVDVIPFTGTFVIDDRPKHPGYIAYKQDLYEKMAATIAAVFGVGKAYSFRLTGNLPVTSGGIGASAAAAVGITRALQAAVGRQLRINEVMEIALAGERAIHGNPSGVDTTAAALDGIVLFQKEEFILFHQKIVSNNPALPLLLVDSQQITNVKETIADVDALRHQERKLWERSVLEYQEIFSQATRVLYDKHMIRLGSLLNYNHDVLARLGLSCCHVERVRQMANNNGALGVKVTGACRGGLVLVLGRDRAHVAQLAAVFRESKYFVIDISDSLSNASAAENPADSQAA